MLRTKEFCVVRFNHEIPLYLQIIEEQNVILRPIFKLINYEDEFRKMFFSSRYSKTISKSMPSKSSNSSSRGSESGLSKTLSVDLETKRQEAETFECQKREMHDRKKNC